MLPRDNPMHDPLQRNRRVFSHLKGLCGTDEARASLEEFRRKWEARFGVDGAGAGEDGVVGAGAGGAGCGKGGGRWRGKKNSNLVGRGKEVQLR